jgi:hypothetical protein
MGVLKSTFAAMVSVRSQADGERPSTTCSEADIPKPMDLSSAGRCALDLGTKSDCATVCYDPSTRRPRRLLLSCRSTFSIAAVRVAWSGCVPNFKESALLTDLNSYVWTNPA